LVGLAAGGWYQLHQAHLHPRLTVQTSGSPQGPPSTGSAPATAGPAAPSATTSQPADPNAAAQRICNERLARYENPDRPIHASLVAAYPSTSGDVAAEDERQRGGGFRSSFRARQPSEFVAVCFFDADAFGLAGSPPPGAPPSANTYNRLEEVVRTDRTPYVLKAGHKDTLSPSPVPSGAGR
jgi:hypothetical protein